MIDRVVVINDSSIAKGGATGLALASAEAFRRQGRAVTLLAGDHGQNEALKAADIDVVALGQARITASPRGRAALNALYNTAAEQMIGDWIARFDTPGTVYHVHGWAQILSPSIFRALRPVAGRLTLSAHDFFLVCPNGSYAFLKTGAVCGLSPLSLACVSADCDRTSYAHKLWRVVRQHILRLNLALGDRSPPILAIHERMRPLLERGGVPAGAIRTLPNPVRPFLDSRAEAEANRDFLFIGRLEDGKGPDLACAAARAAGVPLRIIGDGPMGERLKRDYPEASQMGRLEREAIAPLVSKARALVMPSRYPEPYGLVAAEALWSGLPVITAATALMAPDICARGAGLAGEPRDTAGFAELLRRLANDDDGTRRMSQAAFDRTRDLGSTFEAWIAALIAGYQEQVAAA